MDVALLEPRSGLPDMVFTANGGMVWGNKYIASNFRYEVRRGEVERFVNWFQVRGYEIHHLPAEYVFEGEGDLLSGGEVLFAGYHTGSNIQSHQMVSEILKREVLSLELTNKWFYHLDTCFCPLGKGRALYYPLAFDSYALKVLEDRIPNLIPISEEEAKKFACNAIVAGNDVVMNEGCPDVRSKLERLGFIVHETPLSEFIKAGGSAKCLVLKVLHDEGPVD